MGLAPLSSNKSPFGNQLSENKNTTRLKGRKIIYLIATKGQKINVGI
jgi:hypothetical protein